MQTAQNGNKVDIKWARQTPDHPYEYRVFCRECGWQQFNPNFSPAYAARDAHRCDPAKLLRRAERQDSDVMRARTIAAQRGAKPVEIERAVLELMDVAA